MILSRGLLLASLCLPLAALRTAAAQPTAPAPSTARATQLPLGAARWTDGFWADRFATCRERSIPAMWDLMKSGREKPFLGHFLISAGKAPGEYHGAPWNDGDFYKFLEGVAAAWAVDGRDGASPLPAILDESIPAIAAAQRADGYLHTPVLIAQRNGDASKQPFGDRADFEMYNMGHLLTAACVCREATGRDDLLAVARRTAAFLDGAFRQPTPELARNSVCPSHYMGLVDLYRTTGEPQYLDLARRFLEMRNLVQGGGDDNQDRVPLAQQREAVGHAVRANYLYAGVADYQLAAGDDQYWPTLDATWQNVVEKKLSIVGGCGALYDGASPDGSEEQSQITRIHQAYGRNYQLPSVTAHNETCAAIGFVLWNWRMHLLTGEAKYVDALEQSLLNGVLCGVSLDGDDYFYVNPLRVVEPLPVPLRWSRTRVPFVTSFCCPPNVLRTIAASSRFAWSVTPDGLTANLYGGCRLKIEDSSSPAGPWDVVERTRYPWDGEIELEIVAAPAKSQALRLRIPAWAEGASLRVNGESAGVAGAPGSYAVLRRTWQAGDKVTLSLPMRSVVVEAHPLVEELHNQVAVKRGPLVYCLESPDLPAGVRVDEVGLPSDARFAAKLEPALLGGVTVLGGEGFVTPRGDWDGKLYREVSSAAATTAPRTIALRLIPYYAWSNRGRSEMTVWLPRR